MVVEVVDVPERAARWLEIAHELEGESDVVYVQGAGEVISEW